MTVLTYALAGFVGALVAILIGRAQRERERQAHRAQLEVWQLGNAELRRQYEQERASLATHLGNQSERAIERVEARHTTTLAEIEKRHTAELERVHQAYSTVIEKLGNVTNFGMLKPPEAVVTQEVDAELAVRRRISDETVHVGAQALKREYQALGIQVTDEQARDEALAMVSGTPLRSDFAVPLVRDGP